MSTSGSAAVVAKPSAPATAAISHSDPFLGSSAPMNRPMGRMPRSTPTSSSSMPATTSTEPATNWRNSPRGACTTVTCSTHTTPINGAMDRSTPGRRSSSTFSTVAPEWNALRASWDYGRRKMALPSSGVTLRHAGYGTRSPRPGCMVQMNLDARQDPSTLDSAAVIRALEVDVQRGLTADEATRRLAVYGPNEIRGAPPVPAWKRFLAQFRDPLVYLLLVAVAISLVAWWFEGATHAPVDAIVISLILVLNAVLGYIQEARAQSAVAALARMT